ncbi:uncharacterized protein QC761_0010370 [Podospora bellae-mahoneyi]|uniref:Uncharacterized protein n=1 Tax=Podospora bellae-mahoneyi TaxID=2093777 RepID=A0ABR0FWL8_9PEZI|nr:hypothetical protein QC761_0010370 [Podospora bellae-mahoneyi]
MGVIRIVSFFLASPALLSENSDFPTSFSQLVASDIGGLNGWETGAVDRGGKLVSPVARRESGYKMGILFKNIKSSVASVASQV